MWLGIDAGNSNLVLGIFGEGPRPLRTYRLSTHPLGTADELRARIHAVISLGSSGRTPTSSTGEVAVTGEITTLDNFTDIVLGSVVPAFTRIAAQAFPHLHVLHSDSPFSFKIATDSPSQTGIDRLLNAQAVVSEKRGPAIIIDSGTATTICAVAMTEEQPRFLGGAILPGLEACRDSLPSRAAQLFAVDLTPPPQAIGTNTRDALRSGVVLGYASMIDGMIMRFKKQLPHARVIATGGAAPLLRELCPGIDEWDPELTLKGIAYLYARTTSRPIR